LDELQEVLRRATLSGNKRAEIAELTSALLSNLDKIAQHGKRADAIVKKWRGHFA